MSLQDLQRILQEQAATGAIAVSAKTIMDASLSPVDDFDIKLQKGLVPKAPPSLTISGTIPDPGDTTLQVSGTIKYLAQDVPVSVTFTVDGTGVTSLLFDLTMPTGWSFAKDKALYGTGTKTMHYKIKVDSGPVSFQLSAEAEVGNNQFQGIVAYSEGKEILIGSWIGQDLGVNDILKLLGFEIPDIPSDLDLSLESAAIAHDLSGDLFLLTAKSKNYGACCFAVISVSGKYQLFFILGVGQTISLSELPLVGKELASIEDVQICDMQLLLSSMVSSEEANGEGNAADTQDDTPYTKAIGDLNELIDAVNKDTNDTSAGYPDFPSTAPKKPIQLQATIKFDSVKKTLTLDLGGSASTEKQDGLALPGATALATIGSGKSEADTTTSNDVHWIDVQKSFGPLSIQRIGAMYQSDRQMLWFEIDASLAAGPVTMQLFGLSIGCPLTSFKPEFSLMGLAISYSSPPLTLAGSLVNLAGPGATDLEFEGGVTIGTGDFSLTAFGYYGNRGGFNSLFIYGDVAYDFGGVPPVVITGLALGFGYNSDVRIPDIDEVSDFPFVKVLPTSLVPNTGLFGKNPTPQDVLDNIASAAPPWVAPQHGQVWFAGGITFDTAGILDSQALLLVEFGKDLVIDLIGTSRAQFPEKLGTKSPVYAYIELDLDAVFAPMSGGADQKFLPVG